jgi:hypothetical protein
MLSEIRAQGLKRHRIPDTDPQYFPLDTEKDTEGG